MTTLDAIEQAVEQEGNRGGNHRPHLGASLIGDSCERKLWYTFRWCTAVKHDGRLLRLFGRGNREEETFISLLRQAGVTVVDRDPKTGNQFTFSAVGGHFGGSLDAMLKGLKEANGWHVGEFKTSGDKAFKDLQAKGVEVSKPLHYAQMQAYMKWSNTTQAYYMAVNKNDDHIHAERITYKADVAESLFKKAERIIASDKPPVGISDNGSYYECKWCDHRGTCHEKKVAEVNCRTCIHATPEQDGEARWSCRKHGTDLSVEVQAAACDSHRFIPDLVPFAEAIMADSKGDTITYQMPDGSVFHNGSRGVLSYPSVELAKLPEGMATDKNLDYLRNQFDGWVA
ncbi:MAG: oxidoreductase [Hahellaceae bacterium]|nr:oxidoreductase [Hahellaceae bacterium]